MDTQKHLKVDKAILGKKIPEVHEWIDACFPKYVKNNPFKHWLERHHLEAIEKEFGNNTQRAHSAIFHVMCDWISHFGVMAMPKDKEDCEKLLKDVGAIR